MTEEDEANRRHWESVGAGYDRGWDKPAKRLLGDRELDLVARHLGRPEPETALDVGIGNGRVLKHLLGATRSTRFYGVDVADAMVAVCRERFHDEPRVVALSRCDLSTEPFPFPTRFGYISAVRVLKYNRNWTEMLARLVALLEPGGRLVFTIPNRNSLNRLSRAYDIPWFTATPREVRAACHRLRGVEVEEIAGAAKLPYRAYELGTTPSRAGMVMGTEGVLEKLLGSTGLARELFVTVRREVPIVGPAR